MYYTCFADMPGLNAPEAALFICITWSDP